MITIKNYFQKIKEMKVSSLPASLKEGCAFVKEITENHTTWAYYDSDADIKRTVDEHLANLSEYLGKSSGVKKAPASPGKTDEKTARELAKKFINPYALRGETVEQLSKSNMGSSNGEYDIHIRSGKIHVLRIGTKTVSYSFPLKELFAEIVPASKTAKARVVKTNPRQEKLARQLAKKLLKPFVLRGDTLKSFGTGKLAGSAARNMAYVDAAKDQVNVTALRGKKVDFLFSLKELYNEIRDEVPKANAQKRNEDKSKPVERVDEAVRFIKRFVLMHGKVKTIYQVRSYINSLQRAIIEKRIRKTSTYAKQINFIQEAIIRAYNGMAKPTQMNIGEPRYSELLEIAGSEKVRLSVSYMKRYIAIQGKSIDKEKAQRLHNLIVSAINAGKIVGSDPYMEKINRVISSLKAFVKSARKDDSLHVHEAVLNGINDALDGCGCSKCKGNLDGCTCQQLNGIDVRPMVMNSIDFAEMKFDTIGFQGKWLDLIGDPSQNFTMMVFGKPKMGKSILCLDFAGYLARYHGKVFYVAYEEGLDKTLQDKIHSVKHPNLTVASRMPTKAEIDDSDFIFLDSVNKLGLIPEDLNQLKAENPSKSFIYIFQTTKDGKFRGANTFQHDVDVVIEVPEKGKVVQMGRFNQGGEMEIFEQAA